MPIILLYDDIPMIQVVREAHAGYKVEIPIYHNDGAYLAKVVGPRLVTTPAGDKAGLSLRHPDKMDVCEMNGETVFEIRRAASLCQALHADRCLPGDFRPNLEGYALDPEQKKQGWHINSAYLQGNICFDQPVGIRAYSDGRVSL